MIASCNSIGIKKAVDILQKGGVIVFPTDTVYGLGCDPINEYAINKIYRIKRRERVKGLPILGYSTKDIQRIVFFDDLSSEIAEKFWPGPLTLVLKAKNAKIEQLLGFHKKIAVRVPNHPCTLSLLKKCRLLVGTSANFSGLAPFKDSKSISDRFSGYDLLLDGGKIPFSKESTIVEVVNNKLKIIREGKIKSKSLI